MSNQDKKKVEDDDDNFIERLDTEFPLSGGETEQDLDDYDDDDTEEEDLDEEDEKDEE